MCRETAQRIILIAAAATAFTGCIRSRGYEPAIGEAFVAPMTINLREEIAPRADVTATVKHGDRLEILQRRRRFAKVRTQQGAVGWTDGRQLLSPEGMARLRRASDRARKIPSQGKASPFDALNVHITPNRSSPSFAQIGEEERVDLIGRAVKPRVPYVPDTATAREPIPADAIRDDWSLVRLTDGRSGWVLSRMLMLRLPDEVTQLAEGHRITSYFSLGSPRDAAQSKPCYLWTTIAVPPESHQFDSLRVFVWNPRRNRYETTYIERNLTGYYPVTVEQSERGVPRVRLVAAGRDGILYRRTFEFRESTLHQVEKMPWTLPVEDPQDHLPVLLDGDDAVSLWTRFREWVGSRW